MSAQTPPPGEPPAPAAPAQQRWLPGLRVEIDVTPRWYAPGASFDDDLLAILATWREAGGDLRRMMTDFQAGLSGVRFVLAVPAGVTVDAIENARAELQAAFNALDLVSQRRRAVTEAREKATAGRSRRLQAVSSPRKAPLPAEPPAEPGAAPLAAVAGPPPAEPEPPDSGEPSEPISGTGTAPRSPLPPAEPSEPGA